MNNPQNKHPVTGKPCVPVLAQAAEYGSLDDADIEIELASGEVVTADSLAALRKSERYGEMLEAATTGRVFEVRLNADVFTDKLNKNFIRPTPGDMDGLIERTEAERPILTDHVMSSASHVGYILSLGRATSGSTDKLRARLGFRDAPAQVRTLRGLVRGFSIGWDGDSHECSICSASYESFMGMLWSNCEHQRGLKYDGKVAEMWTTNARLRELSITPFPAAAGTRVRGPRLDEATGEAPPPDIDPITSAPGAPTDEEAMNEDQKKIQELEAQLASVKAELSTEKARAEAAAAFGTELMFTKLQDERRLTPADRASEEVKEVLTLGLATANKILSKWPQRPELSADSVSVTDAASTTVNPTDPAGTPKAPAKGAALSYLREIGAIQAPDAK